MSKDQNHNLRINDRVLVNGNEGVITKVYQGKYTVEFPSSVSISVDKDSPKLKVARRTLGKDTTIKYIIRLEDGQYVKNAKDSTPYLNEARVFNGLSRAKAFSSTYYLGNYNPVFLEVDITYEVKLK